MLTLKWSNDEPGSPRWPRNERWNELQTSLQARTLQHELPHSEPAVLVPPTPTCRSGVTDFTHVSYSSLLHIPLTMKGTHQPSSEGLPENKRIVGQCQLMCPLSETKS